MTDTTVITQVVLVDKNMHCPQGYGFPTTSDRCENALLGSNRITEYALDNEFAFEVQEDSGRDPADARPRCFWHGDGITADFATAGFFESPAVSCKWKERPKDGDRWLNYGAACIKCGGCFGDCWDCGDGLHRESVDTVWDDDGSLKGEGFDGPYEGVIFIFIMCCVSLSAFAMCIHCLKFFCKGDQKRNVTDSNAGIDMVQMEQLTRTEYPQQSQQQQQQRRQPNVYEGALQGQEWGNPGGDQSQPRGSSGQPGAASCGAMATGAVAREPGLDGDPAVAKAVLWE